ncbi:hypothetical protein B0H14DRAFT_2563231 [Mycena olivaceomarginata]|nr:hypothetical protein B0H14DRAFT_2563231 [Mycena olivaceomarginata]
MTLMFKFLKSGTPLEKVSLEDLNALGADMAEGVNFGTLLQPVAAAKQQLINTALQVFETTGAEQEYWWDAGGGGGGGLEQHIATTSSVRPNDPSFLWRPFGP